MSIEFALCLITLFGLAGIGKEAASKETKTEVSGPGRTSKASSKLSFKDKQYVTASVWRAYRTIPEVGYNLTRTS